MKKFYVFFATLFLVYFSLIFAPQAYGQRRGGGGNAARETYTGTVLYYGTGLNTRTVTRPFTLSITGETTDEDAVRFLGILQNRGQSSLLSEINDEDLGYFSVGTQLGRRLNVVRESVEGGQRRLFIVFERWTQFAEVRGGYRSLDYPFGVIELSIDERTGRGEGTYIAAARIRWTRSGSDANQVEIENFATFPARLMGVRRRGGR
ncbi:MAG: hypothetical protein M3384_00775 [Acidobacteriota bacterium]|nr:hypothetical protein [Acidobacteriota bacterium]